jgi:putative Mg2+ transporter-C (MgtC) family protein
MDTLDIAVRLGAATLVGVLLGLNRDLHGKQTGVRTLGLGASAQPWLFCRSTPRPAQRRAA